MAKKNEFSKAEGIAIFIFGMAFLASCIWGIFGMPSIFTLMDEVGHNLRHKSETSTSVLAKRDDQ